MPFGHQEEDKPEEPRPPLPATGGGLGQQEPDEEMTGDIPQTETSGESPQEDK